MLFNLSFPKVLLIEVVQITSNSLEFESKHIFLVKKEVCKINIVKFLKSSRSLFFFFIFFFMQDH